MGPDPTNVKLPGEVRFVFKSVAKSVCAAVLLSVVAACGSHRVDPDELREAAMKAGRKYPQTYISSISVTLQDADPDDNRLTHKKELEAKFPEIIREELEDQGYRVLTTDPGKSEGVALVNVKVTYDPGNRALRWGVLAFSGVGKGTLEVQLDAVDAVSGSLLVSRKDNDTTRGGGFGGNFYDDAEDFVGDMASDLGEALTEFQSQPSTGTQLSAGAV